MSQSQFYQKVIYFYNFSIETAAFDTWSYVQINAALCDLGIESLFD